MSTTHTPGPWTAEETPDNSGLIIVLDSGPECPCFVAMVPDNQINSVSHQQANARLIAAAPDLLTALQRLSFAASCRENTSGDPIRVMETRAELAEANRQAIAAIAKATA